jgi:hypothetical protein
MEHGEQLHTSPILQQQTVRGISMNKYKIQKGDALRDIAVRCYWVYDEQGKPDDDLVETVVERLRWENRALLNLDSSHDLNDSHVSKEIVLPHIQGIPTRDLKQLNTLWRNLRYIILWLSPLLLLLILIVPLWRVSRFPDWLEWLKPAYKNQSFLQAEGLAGLLEQQSQQPNHEQSQSLWPIVRYVLNGFQSPEQYSYYGFEPTDYFLLWLFVWSSLVVAAWLFWLPVTGAPSTRPRIRFMMLWVAGIIIWVISTWASGPADWLLIGIACWTVVVILLFLVLGDESRWYQDYAVPYRWVWAVTAVVALITLITGISSFNVVKSKVDSDRNLASMAIEGVTGPVSSALGTAKGLLGCIDYLDLGFDTDFTCSSLDFELYLSITPTLSLTDTSKILASHQEVVDGLSKRLPDISRDVRNAQVNALVALARTQALTDTQQARNRDMAVGLIEQVIGSTQALTGTLSSISQQIASIKEQITDQENPDSEGTLPRTLSDTLKTGTPTTSTPTVTSTGTTLSDLKNNIRDNLIVPLEEVHTKATLASSSLSSGKVDSVGLFLWTSILFVALVLFPWGLLLLFLIRKRIPITAHILDDLRVLDPEKVLLKRALNLSNWSSVQRGTQEEQLLRSVTRLPSRLVDQQPTGKITKQERDDMEHLINELAGRTFSNVEYILSIVLLSSLCVVGWYFIFYPNGLAGLADIIRKSNGITELAAGLVNEINPISLGFAGAYFYIVQMLFRRYLSDDLYPAAFLQGAVRVLIVFTLSLAIGVMFQIKADVANAGAAMFAFFVGIFPTWGLRAIADYVNQIFGWKLPGVLEAHPLSALDGMNLWTESRLLEENVENIQGMATVSIEHLVVHTHFSAAQLVDWIDQSILYTHSGANGERFQYFRAVGIRSASDLLDVAGFDFRAEMDLSTKEAKMEITPRATALLKLIGEAITGEGVLKQPVGSDADGDAAKPTASASAGSIQKPEKKQPSPGDEIVRIIYDCILPDPNMMYVLNFYRHISRQVTPRARGSADGHVDVEMSASNI